MPAAAEPWADPAGTGPVLLMVQMAEPGCVSCTDSQAELGVGAV